MPHSWYYPTTLIQEKVEKVAPRSVLDVGIGLGKWGYLLREQLDWNALRIQRETWQARIVGIEVYSYESPLHSWVYDEVIRANVLDVLDRAAGFDLVLLSDVIEHIDKAEGNELLRILAKQNRNVIVSTPIEFIPQQAQVNTHENHVSHWTMADFDPFVFDYDTGRGKRDGRHHCRRRSDLAHPQGDERQPHREPDTGDQGPLGFGSPGQAGHLCDVRSDEATRQRLVFERDDVGLAGVRCAGVHHKALVLTTPGRGPLRKAPPGALSFRGP
jgi:SAM-dependent methyltransferase